MFRVFYFVGIAAWMAALWLGYGAIISDVTYDGSANLLAMHMQSANLQVSVGLAIVGTLFIGFGAMMERR